METATRKKIDAWLNNLRWNTDEESPHCNVFTERPKTKEQQNKLEGKQPDYTLYKSNTEEIIGVVEAKRKGKKLDDIVDEAIEKYGEPLDVPVIFVTDGTFVKTWHLSDGKELTIDSNPVNELLSEKELLRFIKEGSDIKSVVSKEVKYTREQLISIFKWANNLLRKEGIREGFDRFIEFGNILFLKLISEKEKERDKKDEERILAKKYCWDTFSEMSPETMLEYINGTVLPHLVDRYNRSGDVFQDKLAISNPLTLKQIVDKLSKLDLIKIESDIKGDAFEYFLKQAVTVGNDLGEYFTPRHIVRLMVKLVNPQFGEKIYDPTCGTGGFLIEGFRHIKKTCKPTKENMEILQHHTVFGREITNTARIAKMNMILTGDGHTNIKQMDSLKHPIKNEYDVVLANPPYGQMTDWGDLYPIPSTQADPIFIQHILLSLTEKGKAAFIVPEGFLFRKGNDEKTRKYLLENFNLVAVISLPPGVFNPYTASKTNILVISEGKTKKVWFYEIHHDGFDLGATREPIDKNDIPDLMYKWENKPESKHSWRINIEDIKKNDYNLTASRYNPNPVSNFEYQDIDKLIDELIFDQKDILKKLNKIKGRLDNGM
jgi:type I restriction enzyme M protein